MKTVRTWITLLLPLALALGGCAERKQSSIVAPDPPVGDAPAVAGAHWIWDRAALGAAVAQAAASPLAERALSESPATGLDPAFQYAISLVATLEDGREISLTLLPYVFGRDSTHAAFISVAKSADVELAEYAELILGRAPNDQEPGFEPVAWGGTTAWVKTGVAYSAVAAPGHPAAMIRKWTKLFDCLAQRMPGGCIAGGAIGGAVSGPGAPAGAAIGCGIGAAAGAAACTADWLGSK